MTNSESPKGWLTPEAIAAAAVDDVSTARTIDSDCADIFAQVLAVARARADERSFAEVMDLALSLSAFWTVSELSDRFDVAVTSIRKWRNADNVPRLVLRDAVMDEFCSALGDIFNRDFNEAPANEFARFDNLGAAARQAIASRMRHRLDAARVVESDYEFVQDIRVIRDLEFASLSDLATRMGYSDVQVKRWMTGMHLPRGIKRTAFVKALKAELDDYLVRHESEAGAMFTATAK